MFETILPFILMWGDTEIYGVAKKTTYTYCISQWVPLTSSPSSYFHVGVYFKTFAWL